MIYLLDLNYTLVANSHEKRTPFTAQIEQEQYRQWLVELLRPHTVYLVTARPAKYEDATIASIRAKTGWEPFQWYFNSINAPPPVLKETVLRHLFSKGHIAGDFFAIESNPATREMYRKHGVKSAKIEEGAEWTTLPA